MTTPSGTISLANVNTELGLAATTTISMNQTNVRTLAGVPSGAISMQNLQNKSNRVTASATITSNTNNYTLNTAQAPGYSAGTTDMTLTINPGVYVSSSSTGSYALTVDTSWSPGDTVTIVNNGVVVGRGGNGGDGRKWVLNGKEIAVYAPGTPGTAAGPALLTQRAVSINNASGRIAGGGGGGGAGGAIPTNQSYGIGENGGGGGIGNGSGGSRSITINDPYANGVSGGNGTLTAAGAGGFSPYTPPVDKNPAGWLSGVPGGNGGSYGSTGLTGYGWNNQTAQSGNYVGGSGGAAVAGNSNITWIATGTRNGAIT